MRRTVIVVAIVIGLTGLATYQYMNSVFQIAPASTLVQGKAVASSAPFFDVEVNQPAAAFTLINQDGETVSLSDYRGKFVVLDFIYTSCPDVCPLLTANLRQVEEALGDRFGQDVHFVSITMDPEYDTPEHLKEYAQAFRSDLASWDFLTGAPEIVDQVLDDYQQTYERRGPREVDHTALTVLIDPNGMERRRYWGMAYPPDLVVEHIASVDRQLAEKNPD